jgi:hypothetical protein
LEPLEDRVVPSMIMVMNTNDSGPGSLRAALAQAEMETTQVTIDFAPSVTGTITLASALSVTTGNIIVDGPGASSLSLTLPGASPPVALTPYLFNVGVDAQMTLSGLTITGDRGQIMGGGGISNAGTLTVADCIISDNRSQGGTHGGGIGGGIENFGTLTVINSTLSGNSVEGGFNAGGGIFNSGTLTVTGSTLSGNSSGGEGGGIDNLGTLTVADCTIRGNAATVNGLGGGIANLGTMTVAGCTIVGNTASGNFSINAQGGGIYNDGDLAVFDTSIGENSGTVGGGIYNISHGTLLLSGSTIRDNSSVGLVNFSGRVTILGSTIRGNSEVGGTGAGGISNGGTMTIADSAVLANTAESDGGGITNHGNLTVTGSTFGGNAAGSGTAGGVGLVSPIGGGAIYNDATLRVIGCTFTGNASTAGFGTGLTAPLGGGGIANHGILTVSASTFRDNSAVGGGGGGIYNDSSLTVTDCTFGGNAAAFGGGGIAGNGGSQTVTNCTFAGNAAGVGGGIFNDASLAVTATIFANSAGGSLANRASFESGGHNLFDDDPAVTLAPTDLINTDPLLAPLGDYGGPTPTQALLPGSPAIDAGIAVPGVTTDQRGVPLPQGQAPDIGAFESRGFTLALVSGGNQGATPGSAFSAPLVVAVASPFGEPVVGGRVTFVAPQSGASASLFGNPATIGPNGQASIFATANNSIGSFTVTAQANGATSSVAFPLTNESGTVASVQRLGVHQQPTQLLLFFNGPLDPAQAEDTSHYTLTTTGRRPRAIALDRAVYDPTTRSVTLLPHERLSLTVAYRLTVRGGGPHGTDFTTQVYGGGFPRWVGATGPGLSNSPLGNDGPTAAQVDALFARSARISAKRHRR